MAAIVGFDFVRYSSIEPADVPVENRNQQFADAQLCYDFNICGAKGLSISQALSFSRFVGKVLIEPLPKERARSGHSLSTKKSTMNSSLALRQKAIQSYIRVILGSFQTTSAPILERPTT